MKIDTWKNIAILNNSVDREIIYYGLLLRQKVLQFYKLQLLRLQVKKERYTLGKLTDRELEDMGISRHDAGAESRRSLRDLPANRLEY